MLLWWVPIVGWALAQPSEGAEERSQVGLRSQEASFLSSDPAVHLPLSILSGPNTGLAQAGLLKNKPQ